MRWLRIPLGQRWCKFVGLKVIGTLGMKSTILQSVHVLLLSAMTVFIVLLRLFEIVVLRI